MISRLNLFRLLFAFVVISVWDAVPDKRAAFASSEIVEITLENPVTPDITIRVNKEYLPSTFLNLVRENRKGGKQRMVMLDVSYPSMKPISSSEAKLDDWESIVFILNSSKKFIERHFQRKTSKRYKKVKSEYTLLKKFIFFNTEGMDRKAILSKAGRTYYYYDGCGNKDHKHLIFCQFVGLKNSKCDAYIQKESGLLIKYHLPIGKISDWQSIYKKFYEFTERFQN